MAGLVVYYLLEVSPGTTKHKCVMYVKQNKDLNCGFGSCIKKQSKIKCFACLKVLESGDRGQTSCVWLGL